MDSMRSKRGRIPKLAVDLTPAWVLEKIAALFREFEGKPAEPKANVIPITAGKSKAPSLSGLRRTNPHPSLRMSRSVF